jgi:hypothetical protein
VPQCHEAIGCTKASISSLNVFILQVFDVHIHLMVAMFALDHLLRNVTPKYRTCFESPCKQVAVKVARSCMYAQHC